MTEELLQTELDEYVTATEFAKQHHLSRQVIYNMTSKGLIHSVHIGRHVYIKKSTPIQNVSRIISNKEFFKSGYVTLSAYAREHGINPGTVYNYIKRGKMNCLRSDGYIYIHKEVKLPSETNRTLRKEAKDNGYVTLAEYADKISRSAAMVNNCIRTGRLDAISIGGAKYVHKDSKIRPIEKDTLVLDGKMYLSTKAFCKRNNINYSAFRQKLLRHKEIETVKIGSIRYINPDTYSFIDRRKVRGKSK